jgi:hypothetical protein
MSFWAAEGSVVTDRPGRVAERANPGASTHTLSLQ